MIMSLCSCRCCGDGCLITESRLRQAASTLTAPNEVSDFTFTQSRTISTHLFSVLDLTPAIMEKKPWKTVEGLPGVMNLEDLTVRWIDVV